MKRILSLGVRAPEVFALQTRLNAAPRSRSPHLSIDGAFGPRTERRTLEFQRASGLKADGVVGPLTWAKLVAGPTLTVAVRPCCDNVVPSQAMVVATLVPAGLTLASTGAAPLSLLSGLPAFPTTRPLSATELALARSVFGGSIDFSLVLLSNKTGIRGRAFVFAIPNPFGKARQIVNVGSAPTRDTLIHELTHVWQSQHHTSSTQFMVNAVASQALEAAVNLGLATTSFSAYGYVPGRPFGEYAAEQIAQQVMRGEPSVVAHVRSVSAGAIDPENVASLSTPRIEDTSLPGVKT